MASRLPRMMTIGLLGGPPSVGLSLAFSVGLSLGAVGCDDEHNLIDSVEIPDGDPLDPGRNPPGRGTDMGADWSPDDAGGDDDPASTVGPGGDDGASIDQDGSAASAPPDLGPPEDDYRVPEEILFDFGLPPDDEQPGGEDDGDMLDPDALRLPRCGTFGLADAVATGPSQAATFLHGSPGVLFDEPAFAGCSPGRLFAGELNRQWQTMQFDYRWGRVSGWYWRIHTLDGAGFRFPGEVSFTGTGRVAEATYPCVGSAEPETYWFGYDMQDRLLQVDVERPAGCEPMAAAESHSVRYRYGADPWLPVARSVSIGGGRLAEIELAYERDALGRVVAIREWTAAGERGGERLFTYDRDGRVSVELRRTVGLEGMREVRTEYAYDREGRLVRRASGDDLLEVGYDAAGELEFVHVTNPAFVVRQLRFPQRSLLEPIPLDAPPADDRARIPAEDR